MSLITSIQRGGSNNHETTSEEANGVYTDFVSQGVLGTIANTSGVAPATGAYAVNAQGTPDMTVAVTAGTAYVTATPSTQASQTFRVVNSASANVTIAANSSGSTKYDWIYLKLDATNLNTPNVAGDDAATLVASRSSSISSDDGTPPTYGILLAIVTVSNGAVTITNGNIKDSRTQASIGASTSDSTGWFNLGATPNTITALGNRSYTVVFNSTDLTDTVSAGMRLRLTRTVSAPTQCADLEASSSQYFSSASAGLAGMTFTDDFTIIIHVPALESYAAMRAVSRIGASSGWSLGLRSDGRVEIIGYNASYANFSSCLSYQSVPLGKAFDIVAQLDMSAFTATPTTSYIMIDGADVPAVVSRGGTNPTSLVQQGDLNIGAYNNASEFFDGKIAQVAIFNAKVTQATARTYLSQGFSGSETNLVSAYSLSNSLLDLNTTNNNDLTANGGALATAVDSPFGNHLGGTLEYAIITKTAFSTNTTLTVQVPEGCAIPTSGGVSAVAYSTQATPYKFPKNRGQWDIQTIVRTNCTQSSPTAATWYNLGTTSGVTGGQQITPPIGVWDYGYETNVYAGRAGSANGLGCMATLSTANNTESDTNLTGRVYSAVNSAVDSAVNGFIRREKPLVALTAVTYYLNYRVGLAGAASDIQSNKDSAGDTVIFAKFAYL